MELKRLTGIHCHVSILSIIEGIYHGQEDFRDDMFTEMILDLDGTHILGGFNKYSDGGGFRGFFTRL